MLWTKRSCNIYKHNGLRKFFPKNSPHFFTCLGVFDFLTQLVGGEINVKETKNELGQSCTQLTIEEDLFCALAKSDDLEMIANMVEKINESGLTKISLYEQEGNICIDIPEIENELDNYNTQELNKKKKRQALPNKKKLTTIYATDSNGVQLDTVFRTIDLDTGEEKYYLSPDQEVEKEKYDEFLRDYVE